MFAGTQSFGSSQVSQGLTMGAATGAAGGDKKAAEEKQTTLPVTIRSIEAAVASRVGDGEVLFHGSEPGMLVLCGMVESVSNQAASVELSLNDSTGRIRVRQYGGAESGNALASVEPGKYVLIAGQLRTSPAVHITAMTARLVTSADEISYHMIEVAHAALRLQRGPMDFQTVDAPVKPAISATVAPAKAAEPHVPAASLATTPVADSKGVDVRSAIVAYLQQQAEGKPEGVPLASVCSHLKSAAESEVRTVLQALVDDGEAYTTLDDDHFALL